MNSRKEEYLQKCTSQRSALMAIVANIMELSEDKTSRNIKFAIAKTFELMIDRNIMVCDDIDVDVLKSIKTFLLTEKAVDDVKNILNNENPF